MIGTFPNDLFAGRRFAVVGLGRNGLPAAQALAAMGAEVFAWDDTAEARAAADAAGIRVRDPLLERFNFDALVLSPGIPHRLPSAHPIAFRALRAGVQIFSDSELLFQAVRASGSKARFVGITGTNGKSTTTALLAHVLQAAGEVAAAGGNLGPAALALPLLPDRGIYVLEMSSYMLERIATLRFDVATMLNLSPDHLDRHGDMTGYAVAKRAIFARQGAADLAVIGVDDASSRAMAAWRRGLPGRVITVSGLAAPSPRPSPARGEGEEPPPLAGGGWGRGNASLPGAHNAQNAAAVVAMARALGVADDAIAHGIAGFPGLPHRQQQVRTIDGIHFVNDSKGTNVDAAARALGCYDRVVWIAGGVAKAGGIAPLVPWFPRVAHAVLIGRDAPTLADTLAAHGVSHEIAGTLDAAVPSALLAARRERAATVLLSPACASFDQFSGFDARGERFTQLVAALGCRSAA